MIADLILPHGSVPLPAFRMKKTIILILICLILPGSFSCSDEEKNMGIEINLGNEPNNTVFWNNAICEDKDYIYVGSSTYLIPTEKDKNIAKINKSDNSVTDLGIRGYNLNVYDGYLYFLNEHGMFKLDLSIPDATPEVVAAQIIIRYMILNDKIYPSGFLNPIRRTKAVYD